MMYLEFMKNIPLADSSEILPVRLILASWAQNVDSHFVDMMYFEFMKNILSPIRASYWLLDSFWPPDPKNVWFPLSRHDVRPVREKFSAGRFEHADGCQTRFGLLSPKTFDSYFLDMMYVELMKNFLHADSSNLMAVTPISASWAQKRLIHTFWTWCTPSSWKIFLSPIRANWWLLDSFRLPEPKNVWFLLSWNDVRRVHEKFSSRRFEGADGC